MIKTTISHVKTNALNIGYEETGENHHMPVILLHGFPDDVRAWDGIVATLVNNGYRTIAPYLRGYGKTHFISPNIMRSGQQAALGKDLLDLMDVLEIDKAILVGYDWGGRAACIVSALWPERVLGLVTIGGYNIQNIARAREPASPQQEYLYWYLWYLNTERGRTGLNLNRREFCRFLWKLWSPNWHFSNEEYELTAESFDNPDFIDVIIHSYRHRLGNAEGDPSLQEIEERLAKQPLISVPSIDMDGACDGLDLPDVPLPDDSQHFSKYYEKRIIPAAGHFLPRESPSQVIQAVLDLGTMMKC